MPDLGGINWLAVLVAVVAAQVLGFLWYGPLFGKQWMAALGKTPEEMSEQGPGPAVVVSVIASILQAVALAIILTMSTTPDLMSGLKIGVLSGVAFAASAVITNSMFENRPPLLMWIYSAYLVVSITLMGVIIGAWR